MRPDSTWPLELSIVGIHAVLVQTMPLSPAKPFPIRHSCSCRGEVRFFLIGDQDRYWERGPAQALASPIFQGSVVLVDCPPLEAGVANEGRNRPFG
jgi:hypothetical protein